MRYLVLAAAFVGLFLESCVPVKMSSRIAQPSQPHVMLRNGDTVFGHSVVVRERFLASKVVVDSQQVFSKEDIVYAHTSWGHRYFPIRHRMMEQVVSGRINVYSKTSLTMQNHPWKPDSTGHFIVRMDWIDYVQKGAASAFLKPSTKAIAGLVQDYKPSLQQIQFAKQMESLSGGSAAIGGALIAIGVGSLFASLFNLAGPDADKLQIIGAGSLAMSFLSFTAAVPTFRYLARQHRRKAIEVYNNRD